MWDREQSDVVRIYHTLEKNVSDHEGEKLFQKFGSSRQEAVRLAVALRGFFLIEGLKAEQKDTFGSYIKRRIRPAAEALVELDDSEHLGELEQLGWLDEKLTDHLLQTAIRQQRSGMTVWLLQLKTREYGFHDRDFQL